MQVRTAVMFVAILALSVTLAGQVVYAAPPVVARQLELTQLVKHDCGSCHGMTLKGGLGPALTPEALYGKPDELLQNVIRHGREHTAMPPWQGMLSEQEIEWIVTTLQSGGFLDREQGNYAQ